MCCLHTYFMVNGEVVEFFCIMMNCYYVLVLVVSQYDFPSCEYYKLTKAEVFLELAKKIEYESNIQFLCDIVLTVAKMICLCLLRMHRYTNQECYGNVSDQHCVCVSTAINIRLRLKLCPIRMIIHFVISFHFFFIISTILFIKKIYIFNAVKNYEFIH